MLVHKTFQYRLLPTQEQKVLINKHLGCSRFVWNYFLSYNIRCYRESLEKDEEKRSSYHNYYKMANLLTPLKKEKEWLKETNSQSLQSILKNLDATYRRFFKKEGGFPKFKSKKHNVQGFNIPQNVKVEDNRVIIPKFKEGIEFIKHRELEGEIKTASITKNKIGHYFVSITCLVEVQPKPKTGKQVGIDLGLKDFAILSNGQKIANPKYYRKTEKHLKFLQKKFSKHKGYKTKRLLQKLYEHTKNQRKDFLHKLSTQIINENDIIVVEDLNVKGMVKNHHLAKGIQDVSWGYFLSFLEYKANWYGKTFYKIDRFFPSSKTCSVCSWINHDLKLSDRVWECHQCGSLLDRDINASVNILRQGLNALNIVGGEELSSKALVAASVGKSDDKYSIITVKEAPVAC